MSGRILPPILSPISPGQLLTVGLSGFPILLDPGNDGQVLTVQSDDTLTWETPSGGGGGGSVDPEDVIEIIEDTLVAGTGITLTPVTGTVTIATDLDGVYAALTHNHDATYAALIHNHNALYAALSHSHATSDITGLTEAVQDIAGALIGNTDGYIGVNYNDGAGTIDLSLDPSGAYLDFLWNSVSGSNGITATNGGFGNLTIAPTYAGTGAANTIARSDHTHTSAGVTDFNEAAQDAVGAALTDSTSIDFTYNDGANTITGAVIYAGTGSAATASRSDHTHSAYAATSHTHTAANVTDFNEAAQDAVGGILTDSTSVDFTYNDGSNTITAAVITAGTGSAATSAKSDHTHTITGQIKSLIGDGSTIYAAGVKGYIQVPFSCTITGWTILNDVTSSTIIDVWKDTYANYPPVAGDSIVAAAIPTTSSAIKATSTTLTGWTTSITAGDIIAFNVSSNSSAKLTEVSLAYTRTV